MTLHPLHTDTAHNRETAAQAHAPVVLLAIAQHVTDQGLPMPNTIHAPNGANDHQVAIWISHHDLAGWLASGDVVLGHQTVRPMPEPYTERSVMVAAVATFAATGARFQLNWCESKR